MSMNSLLFRATLSCSHCGTNLSAAARRGAQSSGSTCLKVERVVKLQTFDVLYNLGFDHYSIRSYLTVSFPPVAHRSSRFIPFT